MFCCFRTLLNKDYYYYYYYYYYCYHFSSSGIYLSSIWRHLSSCNMFNSILVLLSFHKFYSITETSTLYLCLSLSLPVCLCLCLCLSACLSVSSPARLAPYSQATKIYNLQVVQQNVDILKLKGLSLTVGVRPLVPSPVHAC